MQSTLQKLSWGWVHNHNPLIPLFQFSYTFPVFLYYSSLLILLYFSSSLILFQPSYTFPALLYFSSPLILFQPSYTFPVLLYFSSPLILFQFSYTFPALLYFSPVLRIKIYRKFNFFVFVFGENKINFIMRTFIYLFFITARKRFEPSLYA